VIEAVSDALNHMTGFIRYRSHSGTWPRPIFVIGTGRSGTHWVGEILAGHPDIYVSVERRRFFRDSTRMAIDPPSRERLFGKLARSYRYEIARVAPRHYADKSHTNIWIADRLAKEFPDAVFVGVRRDVFGTVSSMLKHRGVLRWIEDWKRYPIPNPFLGIREGEEDRYELLSLAAKCAARWVSHEERFNELAGVLGDRLVTLNYEQLHVDPAGPLRNLERALGLSTAIAAPTANREALDRWRNELTEAQVEQIRAVVDGSAARVS
jgi:hypothetical protein